MNSHERHGIVHAQCADTITKLEWAIAWMCTEMPVTWAELAIAEGQSEVVEVVRTAVAHVHGNGA